MAVKITAFGPVGYRPYSDDEQGAAAPGAGRRRYGDSIVPRVRACWRRPKRFVTRVHAETVEAFLEAGVHRQRKTSILSASTARPCCTGRRRG